jgi:hypothetical protein
LDANRKAAMVDAIEEMDAKHTKVVARMDARHKEIMA